MSNSIDAFDPSYYYGFGLGMIGGLLPISMGAESGEKAAKIEKDSNHPTVPADSTHLAVPAMISRNAGLSHVVALLTLGESNFSKGITHGLCVMAPIYAAYFACKPSPKNAGITASGAMLSTLEGMGIGLVVAISALRQVSGSFAGPLISSMIGPLTAHSVSNSRLDGRLKQIKAENNKNDEKNVPQTTTKKRHSKIIVKKVQVKAN